MSTTDLLGDPLPDPLPTRERLRDVTDLVGHTIRAVFDGTSLHAADLVIVTDSLCWLVLEARTDGDDAYITECGPRFGGSADLADHVMPRALLNAGCISHAEFEALQEKERQATEAKKQREIEFHRAQLAKLGAASVAGVGTAPTGQA